MTTPDLKALIETAEIEGYREHRATSEFTEQALPQIQALREQANALEAEVQQRQQAFIDGEMARRTQIDAWRAALGEAGDGSD